MRSKADINQFNLLRRPHGVSLEEEKESYGGKDLQKREVLSLE